MINFEVRRVLQLGQFGLDDESDLLKCRTARLGSDHDDDYASAALRPNKPCAYYGLFIENNNGSSCDRWVSWSSCVTSWTYRVLGQVRVDHEIYFNAAGSL